MEGKENGIGEVLLLEKGKNFVTEGKRETSF